MIYDNHKVTIFHLSNHISPHVQLDLVVCTGNSVTLEVDFRHGVGLILVEANSTSIGGWVL